MCQWPCPNETAAVFALQHGAQWLRLPEVPRVWGKILRICVYFCAFFLHAPSTLHLIGFCKRLGISLNRMPPECFDARTDFYRRCQSTGSFSRVCGWVGLRKRTLWRHGCRVLGCRSACSAVSNTQHNKAKICFFPRVWKVAGEPFRVNYLPLTEWKFSGWGKLSSYRKKRTSSWVKPRPGRQRVTSETSDFESLHRTQLAEARRWFSPFSKFVSQISWRLSLHLQKGFWLVAAERYRRWLANRSSQRDPCVGRVRENTRGRTPLRKWQLTHQVARAENNHELEDANGVKRKTASTLPAMPDSKNQIASQQKTYCKSLQRNNCAPTPSWYHGIPAW